MIYCISARNSGNIAVMSCKTHIHFLVTAFKGCKREFDKEWAFKISKIDEL